MRSNRSGLAVGFVFTAWLLFVLFDLALVAGVIYVAWHFISKFW